MALSARILTREIGTALAVLAIYVLTLLLPLHQAAASQRDFNALGFSTISSWSVCAQLAADADGEPAAATALSCPAIGIAKQFLAAADGPVLILPTFAGFDLVGYGPTLAQLYPTLPDHVGQSRAPPVPA